MYYVGVEGGTTGSVMVLLNKDGDILSRAEASQLNQWQIGVENCTKLIAEMLEKCKNNANLQGCEIEAIGLGLSGLDTQKDVNTMVDAMKTLNLAKHYFACNDTLSTLGTVTDTGGIVLISGTGSNCLYVTDDGQSYRTGGWGNMLGDEGSAYFIAHTALKTLVDHEEGLKPTKMSTAYISTAMKEHFNITDRMELLPYLYTNFVKSKIANLTPKLAKGADDGDELCLHIFELAGRHLGRHIQGVLRSSGQSSVRGPLRIVCTGGVFKSFHLLKSGFLEGILLQVHEGDLEIPGFELIRLKESAAIGAAFLAARSCDQIITRQFDNLAESFYSNTF